MSNYRHDAVIVALLPKNKMKVEIARTSACASCSVKGGCGVNEETPNNSFIVNTVEGAKIGDTVTISLEQKKLYKSATIVYIYPILFMLLTGVVVDQVFHKEIYTAISTLFALGIYFIGLKFVMQNKVSDLTVTLSSY